MLRSNAHAGLKRSAQVDWIWLAIGIIAGINVGVALMALLQLSPGLKKAMPKPHWNAMAGVHPLEGQSTIF